MPKLLIVTTVASTLRAFLLPYAHHFRSLGWHVDCMARDAAEASEVVKEFDSCFNIPFTRKPWALRDISALCERIRDIVRENGYDIVHVHTPVASFVTRFALRKMRGAKPKVIYTAHGFHFYRGGSRLKNLIYLTLEKLAARWTDALITINDEDYNAAVGHRFLPADRIALMPGIGLDLSAWARSAFGDVRCIRSDVYAELGLSPETHLFLMVAEFNPGKHHLDAVNALSLTGRSDIHIAFAGDGRLREAIVEKARAAGLERQTHFLGMRSDIPRLMLASDALLLPSEREGLNRSVMESVSLGVPVLGADVRGIRDIITDDSRGILFPACNPQALADAMLKIITERKRELPQPDPRWDIKNLLHEHEKLYERVMKR